MRYLLISTAIVAAAAAGYFANDMPLPTVQWQTQEAEAAAEPEAMPTVSPVDIPETADDARVYAQCSGFWRSMADRMREYDDPGNAATGDDLAEAAHLAAFEVLRVHAGHGPIAHHTAEYQQATEWANAEFLAWSNDPIPIWREQHDLCAQHADRMTGLAIVVETDRRLLEPIERMREIERQGGAVWFVEPIAPTPLPR